jgi:hypothetical protein
MSDDPNRYQADGPIITQAQLDAARAEGRESGLKEGRDRLSAVLNLPEAEGREAQAKALALTTDLDPAACAGILSAAPKAEAAQAAPAQQSEFAAHMAAIGNPQIGPDSGQASQSPDAGARAWGYAFAQQQSALKQ